MDRILLLTNCQAGSNDDEAVRTAADVLRTTASVEVVTSSDTGELDACLDQRDGRDLVIAGGDGSLHAVVERLHARGELDQPVLGLIPLGTGNDFARGVSIPLDPAAAAEVVRSGLTRDIDMLVDDEGGVVVNAVHSGVGAEAGLEARTWKRRLGKLGYLVGALIAGFRTHGVKVVVEADDTTLADGTRRVLQVGIGNGRYIGGGTPLSPDADPTDGWVDVLVSFSVPRRDRFLYALHLRRGTHDERHDVRCERARRTTVRGDRFWVNSDGELLGPLQARTWTLRPAAFAMRLPTPEQAEPSP